MSEISFSLKPVPPFSLEFTAWALRRRPQNLIDRWDGNTYRRIILVDGQPLLLSVRQQGPVSAPKLRVKVKSRDTISGQGVRSKIVSLLDKMFALRKDLSGFYAATAMKRDLRTITNEFTGLKPPRFPSIFESLLNAFACQQVSLDVGIILLNRLATAFGRGFKEEGEVLHALPLPEDLAGVNPVDFRALGLSRQKGRAIVDLSKSIISGEIRLDGLELMSNIDAMEVLYHIRGVGRWSAEYVLLRGLGRLDSFPGDDVGAQRNIASLFRLEERPDYEKIRKITSRWQPYQGFVYFHFLLRNLKRKGHLL